MNPLTPVTESVNQLVGRDIAVILGVVLFVGALGFVFVSIYLVFTARAQMKMARSVSRLANNMARKQAADEKRASAHQAAIQQLIETNAIRTNAADKAYGAIFALQAQFDGVNLKQVIGELRTSASEMTLIARTIEGWMGEISSTALPAPGHSQSIEKRDKESENLEIEVDRVLLAAESHERLPGTEPGGDGDPDS